jgi:hypothetical protein
VVNVGVAHVQLELKPNHDRHGGKDKESDEDKDNDTDTEKRRRAHRVKKEGEHIELMSCMW